jgi:sulfite reductase alpha subunit-like flavoprotein
MLILYGSQTGTAEDFAHQLEEECVKYGFKPEVADMVDFYPVCNFFANNDM